MNLTEKVFCDSFKNKLFELCGNDPKVIVAFSGGCDSLGLLLLCSKTLPHKNLKAVYVNHNIRKPAELEAEEELNCFNCDSLHIPLTIREIPRFKVSEYAEEHRCGLEAAARILRYEILEDERVKKGFDFILTAHHLDDQIETVYMKKIQNAPLSSLRGIAEVSNHVVRPLLNFSRKQIKDFVLSSGLSFSNDSTNSDNSILRNKLRNKIIPQQIKKNSNFEAEILSVRDQAVIECNNFTFEGNFSVKTDYFNALTEAQKNLCLFAMWDKVVGSVRGLSKSLIERVVSQCRKNENKIVESNGGCFDIYNGVLYLTNTGKNIDYENYEVCINDLNNGTIELLEGKSLVWGQEAPENKTKEDLVLNKELFTGKVVIRYVHLGDRIELKDGSKTVLRLLQDLKIAPSLRYRVPVIADEDGVCAVFASVYFGRNRIAKKFCNVDGARFVFKNAVFDALADEPV